MRIIIYIFIVFFMVGCNKRTTLVKKSKVENQPKVEIRTLSEKQGDYQFTLVNSSDKVLVTSPFVSNFNQIIFIFDDNKSLDFHGSYFEKDIVLPGEVRIDTVNMPALTQEMCIMHYNLKEAPHLVKGYTCRFYWIVYDKSSPIDPNIDKGKPENYHAFISDTITIKI